MTAQTAPSAVHDVRKSVIVEASAAVAFQLFADLPIEWWPEKHVFVEDRQALTIEPEVGGRYYETGADGREVDWGSVVEWEPGSKIKLTWRVGPYWQPITDDERASFIVVDFEPVGPTTTMVSLTHADLHRHGDAAEGIFRALDGPSPGDTLVGFAAVVERHAPVVV